MVKVYCLHFILFFLLSFPLSAQDVIVEAFINQNQGIANHPIAGTITVTHPKKDRVDPLSFQLEGRPLTVAPVREVDITSGEMGTVISIYEFELPAKEKGLYMLAPISVMVKTKTYSSTSSSYEIKNGKMATAPAGSEQAILRLEASVLGPSPLYPGQRATLFYRIIYNKSIDLTYSELPLLHTQEFQKIGDEQIKDYEKEGMTYQDITQEIEAFKPGAFHYGPSIIEGYAYQLNSAGQKVYQPHKLRAEAPSVKVVVNPFPIAKQPASFNGMLGKLNIQLKMLTPNEITLGEQIELEMAISNSLNLADIRLPILQCQPGFSGFFQFNDLPPIASIKNGVKSFQIQLRPISLLISTLPSIEISSFDPKTLKYLIWRSTPLPLKVKPPILPDKQQWLSPFSSESIDTSLITKFPFISFQPIETRGIKVEPTDLTFSLLRSHWVLWMVPLGGVLICLQWYWHQKWIKHKQQAQKTTSEDLFNRALKAEDHLDQSNKLYLLEKAFLLRLKERSYLTKTEESLELLPYKGVEGEIRSFLMDLQALQYGFQKEFNMNQIRNRAKELFNKI